MVISQLKQFTLHFNHKIRRNTHNNVLTQFKTLFPNEIQYSKAFNQPFDDDFKAKITPYNSPLLPIKDPAIFASCKDEQTLKKIIKFANNHNASIIPIGGNTNLVRAMSHEMPANKTIPLVVYLKYNKPLLDYCSQTKTITCSSSTRLSEVNEFLKTKQRRINIHLSADPTIGGMVGTNTGGEYAKMNHLINQYELLCGDLNHRLLSPHPTQTNSMLPTFDKKALTAPQGMGGLITKITLHTEPEWQSSLSSLSRVPMHQITPFRNQIKALVGAKWVAGELMDHHCIDAAKTTLIKCAPNEMVLLNQFASTSMNLNLDQMWETLVEKFPEISSNTIISNSTSDEALFWGLRHHISDGNRLWSKKQNLTYIGYDLDIPKSTSAKLITEFREYLETYAITLFCFGHSMQSETHDTLHLNVAFPKKSHLNAESVSELFIEFFNNKNVYFSAEHGGLGHKSIDVTLKMKSKNEIKETIQQIRNIDPKFTFRKDIYFKLDELTH